MTLKDLGPLAFKAEAFENFTVKVDGEYGVGVNQYKLTDVLARDIATHVNALLAERIQKFIVDGGYKIVIEKLKVKE